MAGQYSFKTISFVFVSVDSPKGKDTSHNFTDNLYAALYQDIAPGLLYAIEKSRLVLVILSHNYARSNWCLDELMKIMECREEMGKIVFPVFYHVDPSHVRNQKGSYGEALAYHERNGFDHKTQRWRAALSEVGSLSGWHVHDW
ncbi:hypothetical protein AAG906_019634 [Vitis piasezkii]